jgi:hypothetical protein
MKSVPSFALPIIALSMLLCLPVRAREANTEIQIGTRLVCDTQRQAMRFAVVFNGDVEMALKRVNAEENDPTACVMLPTVYYVAESDLGDARSKNATFKIVKITILGIVTAGGIRPVQPAEYFSAFAVDERRA